MNSISIIAAYHQIKPKVQPLPAFTPRNIYFEDRLWHLLLGG